MTEEEKAAAVAAEEKVAAEAAAAKAKAEEVDYKAELEKETARRLAQAEHTIVSLKKEAKEKGEPKEVDTEAIKEALRAELMEEQKKELEAFKVEQAKGSLDEEIAKISSNPDEQALIKFHYEKSIQKTGFDKNSIASDIQNAFIIANKPRLEKTMEELRQKAISNVTKKGNESGGIPAGADNNKLDDATEAWIEKTAKARGMKPEDIRAKLVKNSS